MRNLLKVLRDQSGIAAMEYAVIGTLVGTAVIVSGGVFFTELAKVVSLVSASLTTAIAAI